MASHRYHLKLVDYRQRMGISYRGCDEFRECVESAAKLFGFEPRSTVVEVKEGSEEFEWDVIDRGRALVEAVSKCLTNRSSEPVIELVSTYSGTHIVIAYEAASILSLRFLGKMIIVISPRSRPIL